jgi:hypothetical protein
MYIVWLLLSFFNRQALLLLACLFVYHVFYFSFKFNFEPFILMSMTFSWLTVAEINIKSKVRHVFACFSLLYWLSAVDEFLFYKLGLETGLRFARPYIVIILNAYLITILFQDKRPNLNGTISKYFANFGFTNLFNFLLARLQTAKEKATRI